MHLSVKLPETGADYLKACARIRRTSVTNLIVQVIETVARDQLVLAVLDDDSQPYFRQKEEQAWYPR